MTACISECQKVAHQEKIMSLDMSSNAAAIESVEKSIDLVSADDVKMGTKYSHK